MKIFLHALGIVASIGIYLIVFALMYALTQKEVLEIMAVDIIIVFPVVAFITGNIKKITRRI